jgi:hypothetical protein
MKAEMKTERVVMLTTPEFKARLSLTAKNQGISVGELVRSRFDKTLSEEEQQLMVLTAKLRDAVKSAKQALREGLAEVNQTLTEIRASRTPRAEREIVKTRGESSQPQAKTKPRKPASKVRVSARASA